jgi:ubiquitin ligase complex F-box protein UFO1
MVSDSPGLTFLQLPVELIIQVLSHLDVSDIYNVYDTCHFLQDIINDEELWKNLFLQKFKTVKFSSISKSQKFSIELIKRQQLLATWKKSAGIHKNLILDVPNVEKLIFQYPRVLSFSDQGTINITSIEKGKSEVTIPLTTPSGCTSYHFNPSGSVFGRYDGKIFSKQLNNKSAYLGRITEFLDQHQGSVTSIYNDNINCFSGDEHGEVYKWDLKTRELLKRLKVSQEGIVKLKGLYSSIIAIDYSRIHFVDGDVIKTIDLNDLGTVEFFEVDFPGKLIVVGSLKKLRVYSFAQFTFGKFHELDFNGLDMVYKVSLEEKNHGSVDYKIAGADGCNLGVLTRKGLVFSINIRDIITSNGTEILPQATLVPIFDNFNAPEGVPPISSIAINSSVILLGSYNGFAAIYDALTGEFLRTASVRIPKRYLPLTENSFLIPVKAVQLGPNNGAQGLLLVNNVIQYFQFGAIENGMSKKKTKKLVAGAASDRKNKLQKKIKHDIDELRHHEYEMYKKEKLLNKYNGDELTDQEQIELAMVLNDSLQEGQRRNQSVREGKQVAEDMLQQEEEEEQIDDDLARALELSRLEDSYENHSSEAFEETAANGDEADDEYERQLQEALRRSLYD